jgi:cold shock CspA family protein
MKRERTVQGTIKTFDDTTRTGSLLTDDRTEIAIDERSATPMIRTLRPGQRVIFDTTDETGTVVARSLRVVTFES